MSRNRQTSLLKRREARRVGELWYILELLEMAEVLINQGFPPEEVADALVFPTQGSISALDRMRQGFEIVNAWPEKALRAAARYNADWHSLYEPARAWRNRKVEREEVLGFARDYVQRKQRWPTADDFRVKFGYAVTGHKGPGDHPDQESLLAQ